MALVVLHTDNFNRSDRALNGDTMSDGLGTWAAQANIAIVSNQASMTSSAVQLARDSVMSDVDVQRASVKWISGEAGPATRASGTSDCYWGDKFTTNGFLFRRSGGANTLIGSNASSNFASGDTFSLDSSGSSHTILKNGSATVGPVTDATFATGKAGFFNYGGPGAVVDDWQVEVESAPTSTNFIGVMFGKFLSLGGM